MINSDNAVVVNFHAEWCEPCKILTPKMTELLEDNPDIDLAVVDVDSNIEWVVEVLAGFAIILSFIIFSF